MNRDLKEVIVLEEAVPSSIFEELQELAMDWHNVPYTYTPGVSYPPELCEIPTGLLEEYPTNLESHWVTPILGEDAKDLPKLKEAVREAISSILHKILDPAEAVKMVRAKLNVIVAQKSGEEAHIPHVDLVGPQYISGVLYLNNSDGPTIIYNKKCEDPDKIINGIEEGLEKDIVIYPKANRCVLFPSEVYHTSSTPHVLARERVVLNFVFEFIEAD